MVLSVMSELVQGLFTRMQGVHDRHTDTPAGEGPWRRYTRCVPTELLPSRHCREQHTGLFRNSKVTSSGSPERREVETLPLRPN
jgi:hypothetical protein